METAGSCNATIEDKTAVQKHGMYAITVDTTHPLVMKYLSEDTRKTIIRDWRRIREAALATFSQTLTNEIEYVIIHGYPIHVVNLFCLLHCTLDPTYRSFRREDRIRCTEIIMVLYQRVIFLFPVSIKTRIHFTVTFGNTILFIGVRW